MTKIPVIIIGCFALSLGLSACGRTTGDRSLSGAAIGAGVGAAGAAVTGGAIDAGALIGGAVGGITGAATRQSDIYLGKPIWRDHSRRCRHDNHGGWRC